ncbi:MAG: hypothetical protein OEQ29_10575 [Alphaproteobacteria bacterium]|nr:hypothetical protein [Alphaproteobacteria bacterium]
MTRRNVTRRLVAILAADVVGYSAMMDADEVATYDRWSRIRKDIIEPQIAEHVGRIFTNAGDGFLAEFASAAEAVECAVGIQQAMARRNREAADGDAVLLRVGVNLGEIEVNPDNELDIHGHGINVAARLESLADPGTIFVSEDVVKMVRRKVGLSFVDRGTFRVKNIVEPISVFSIDLGSDGAVAPATRRSPTALHSRSRRLVFVAAFIVLIALGGWWQWPTISAWFPGGSELSVKAPPLPEKPSVAVLALTNLSRDRKEEYFSDGITEDIITDLSKISGLMVISRNSSFTYKGRAVRIQRIGRELGVRYVVEGSVIRDRVRNVVRIHIRLFDARSGVSIWSDVFDEPFDNILSVQDRITQKIVARIGDRLGLSREKGLARGDELKRIQQRETTSADAYDAFLQGWQHFRKVTPADYARAIVYFEKAIHNDRNYARAYAALAAVYLDIRTRSWHRHPDLAGRGIASRYQAMQLAQENLAKALKKPTAIAHFVAARMRSRELRHQEALEHARQAVAFEPNNPDLQVLLAMIQAWNGKPRLALPIVEKAMRLDPRFPASYVTAMGIVRFNTREYDAAADALERGYRRNPENALQLVHLLATYGRQILATNDEAQKRRIRKKAHDALSQLNRARKRMGEASYNLTMAERRTRYVEKADQFHFLDGLKAAGVPPRAGKK